MIKVRIDKGNSNTDCWYHGQIGNVFTVCKTAAYNAYRVDGLPNAYIITEDCTVISDDTQPEHGKWCIKRTPENAEVLNRWANSKGVNKGHLYNDAAIMYSEKVDTEEASESPYLGVYTREIIEGFTELSSVEEFFEKVNYKPEPKVYEIINVNSNDFTESKPEPVLIAKAGEFIKITQYKDVITFIKLNKPYELTRDLYESSETIELVSDHPLANRFVLKSDKHGIKFEKCPAPIEEQKPERIPFDLEKWKTGKYDVVNGYGHSISIICENLKNSAPIVAIRKESTGNEFVSQHNEFGKCYADNDIHHPFDLFIVPKTTKVWVNIYESEDYESKESAIVQGKYATPHYCKYIETIEVIRPLK